MSVTNEALSKKEKKVLSIKLKTRFTSEANDAHNFLFFFVTYGLKGTRNDGKGRIRISLQRSLKSSSRHPMTSAYLDSALLQREFRVDSEPAEPNRKCTSS